MLKVVTVFLLLGAVPAPVLGQSAFIVTSPKKAKYDTTTTFSVSASGLTQPETIHLLLRTGDSSEIVLNETRLLFTQDGVQRWNVIIDSDRMTQYLQNMIHLRAEFLSKVEITRIPMDSLSGFLMIQTDKVIYTPRQTVMYRVIALDNDQRFSKWNVTVDIKNPDLIILERQHHTSEEAFIGKNFSLPRDATPGIWYITATFRGSKVLTTKTIEFDVKEYVLPTFKVEVTCEEKVIALATDWIRVKVKAVYSYGQPVRGRVQVRLGVLKDDRVVLFDVRYNGTLDSSGELNVAVPVLDLRGHSLWYPNGNSMYLAANVTEDGTGEVETGIFLNTVFANPYYHIDFSDSKEHFRPGFEYTLMIDVKAANGDAASNIMTYVTLEVKNENNNFVRGANFARLHELDEHGRMNMTFPVPAEAHAMRIQVYTLDPAAPSLSVKTFTVRKYQSDSNTYLCLKQEGNAIRIIYTPSLAVSQQQITVLMTSKGRLMYATSIPRTSVGSALLPLSHDLLVAASPMARVVAYFYVGSSGEVVADGMLLDTEDMCEDELSLEHDSHAFGRHIPHRPKQTSELYIYGGSNMRVGLLAVDKAVYFLKDERSLTREKVFATLDNSHEGQKKMGDLGDTKKIFEFAGLQYLKMTDEPSVLVTAPSMVDFLDVGRLNEMSNARRGNNFFFEVSEPLETEESIPIDKIRKYFPESWFFKEVTLSEDGYGDATITMPDSITTWAFTAVGVAPGGGVCMSRPRDIRVFKPFFGDIRLPYKAVRLEEVTVDINIYNYQNFPINMTVTVKGGKGVCFSEGFGGQQRIEYRATVLAGQTNSESLRLIPLLTGSVKLTVDIRSTNRLERDIVEKTLHVVAEGRRMQKSITFPLDPSGRRTHSNLHHLRLTNTASVSNQIMRNNTQMTSIDLYMPQEVIHGSEKCQISACGDLMGDIINTAVLQGDNLFESSVVDAEEAIGNLAPTVHALLYLNQSHFMTPFVSSKGKSHVKYGVVRLLKYRKSLGSFALTPDSQPATWLTSLVLKTLCQAEQITFIDNDVLIRQGFDWLLEQIRENGSLSELDRRLARPSVDYDIMLSAETMIALLECGNTYTLRPDDWHLQGSLETLLIDHIHHISSPLVMAKVAYALTLSEPGGEDAREAVDNLVQMMRTSSEGLQYWSVTSENEPPRRPFWYHSGTKASSIEATAYALLVFLHQTADMPDVSLDSIAGWLIQKRNSHGAFIGAMDTAAATQAIAEYSLANLGLEEVNLHCNVTTRPTRNYTHSFDFNEDNAIMPKSLSNVPVGRQLHIETQGTGLGQMQVRVEYNVPVDTNAECRYNISITRHTILLNSYRRNGNDMCRYCNMGCDEDTASDSTSRSFQREKRQITANRVSICIQVCIRSTDNTYADRTILTIDMLSGFEPIRADLEQIYERRDTYHLSSLVWLDEKAAVEMKFNQVPNDRSTCVSFRATERRDVSRRNPAIVTVRSHDDQEATCVEKYDPVVSEVNLAVYCANNQTNNLGQCRCFSGHCGMCHTRSTDVDLSDVQHLVCNSEYIYKIQLTSNTNSEGWIDMTAEIINTEKHNDEEEVGPTIHMVTPRTCRCPHSAGLNSHHYFFGSHVDTFVNRNNGRRKVHLLDSTTTFISPSLGTSDQNRTQNWIRMGCGN